MAILNYTTKIKTEKTVMEIQEKLAKAGAIAVLCEYDPDGIICAISFRINTEYGVLSFRLPAQIDGVYRALEKSKIPRSQKTHEQASRVAWRIIKDWVEAQLAIIEAGIAELPQVFLPYAQTDDGATLYERLEGKKFNQLLIT